MRKSLLFTTAAASLLYAVVAAQAQDASEQVQILRTANFERPADCPAGARFLTSESTSMPCVAESGNEKNADESEAAGAAAESQEVARVAEPRGVEGATGTTDPINAGGIPTGSSGAGTIDPKPEGPAGGLRE